MQPPEAFLDPTTDYSKEMQKNNTQGLWETAMVDETKDFTGVTKIFGYGSMVWKPPVPENMIISKYPAIIKGFYRRFWMKSSDHRGTVEKPGYVLTLIKGDHRDVRELPAETTLGMVFDVKMDRELLKDIDIRERNGYCRTLEEVENTETGEKSMAIVYYAVSGCDEAYSGP